MRQHPWICNEGLPHPPRFKPKLATGNSDLGSLINSIYVEEELMIYTFQTLVSTATAAGRNTHRRSISQQSKSRSSHNSLDQAQVHARRKSISVMADSERMALSIAIMPGSANSINNGILDFKCKKYGDSTATVNSEPPIINFIQRRNTGERVIYKKSCLKDNMKKFSIQEISESLEIPGSKVQKVQEIFSPIHENSVLDCTTESSLSQSEATKSVITTMEKIKSKRHLNLSVSFHPETIDNSEEASDDKDEFKADPIVIDPKTKKQIIPRNLTSKRRPGFLDRKIVIDTMELKNAPVIEEIANKYFRMGMVGPPANKEEEKEEPIMEIIEEWHNIHRPPNEIRLSCFAWKKKTLSKNIDPATMFQDLHYVLIKVSWTYENRISFKREPDYYCFKVFYVHPETSDLNVAFEAEIFKIHMSSTYQLKFKRTSGNSIVFKDIQAQILFELKWS